MKDAAHWHYVTEFEVMTTTSKFNAATNKSEIERVAVFHWHDADEKKDAYIGFVWRPLANFDDRFEIFACNANDSKRLTEPVKISEWVKSIVSYTFPEIGLEQFEPSQQIYKSVAEDFNKWLAHLIKVMPKNSQLLPM